MPGLRNVRTSELNRQTYELIKKGVIEPIDAQKIASEYNKVVVKLDKFDESLKPILIDLETVFNDYMQVRGQYVEKSHAAQNKTLLNQAAADALQKITELHIELKQKVVSFIEYAINVSVTDQNEENMQLLQFTIVFHFNTYEIITGDKKYCGQHQSLLNFESATLAGLAASIRAIKMLIDKVEKPPSKKHGLSALLFMFNKDDNSELFVKFDKAIVNFKKLFISYSLDGSPRLQEYRQRMVKFYTAVEATQNNRPTTQARLTAFKGI